MALMSVNEQGVPIQAAPQQASIEAAPSTAPAGKPAREVMYRHSIMVRLTHWINALCLVLLLMSGLRLFNYHPSLYWGNYGYRGVPSFISIGAIEDEEK